MVVFYHWQFFVGEKVARIPFVQSEQPFYGLLWPAYGYGGMAVDFFFSLSGFIFYWLNAARIARGGMSPGKFFVLRCSRLYPLHFATLWLVLILQSVIWMRFGQYAICNVNDFPHFVLHLFFASNWFEKSSWSFNTPVWSVSVECVLYAVFFVVCARNWRRWWHLLALALAGYVLETSPIGLIGRGMFSFFLGASAYYLLTYLQSRRIALRPWAAALTLVAVWAVVIPASKHFPLYHLYRETLGNHLLVAGRDVIGFVLLAISGHLFEIVAFPATLFCMASIESAHPGCCRRVAFMGDLSYSIYLLHLPLMMLFVAGAWETGLQGARCYSPALLLLYLAILLPLAWASYRYWERPAQEWMRALLTGKKPAARGKPETTSAPPTAP